MFELEFATWESWSVEEKQRVDMAELEGHGGLLEV
jgi:hypothetical protein